MPTSVSTNPERPVVADGTPAIVDMYRNRRGYFWANMLLPVAAGIACLMFVPGSPGLRALLAGFVWALSFVALAMPHMRGMERRFMVHLAKRNGFEYQGKVPTPNGVPYFGHGTLHRLRNAVSGTWNGIPMLVATHAYVDRENDPQTATVCIVTLPPEVARRFAGISCRGRITAESGNVVERYLDGEQQQEFESSEFHRRYVVTTVAAQDQIAVRELFSPVFLEWLTTTYSVYWEQRGSLLVSWGRFPCCDEAIITEFMDEVVEVTRRYLDEWQ